MIFPITVTPQMINPQDATLTVQAAIKNMSTNGVFYFGIPVAMEVRNLRNMMEEENEREKEKEKEVRRRWG